MIEGYEKDRYGVIKQISPQPFNYDLAYANAYNDLGVLNDRMSYLRLGLILGIIGGVPESLLDVGYGNGSFLKAASDIVPETFGHDISGFDIPEKSTFVEDILSRHFEVITFFDCLEHYHDISFVKDLNCELLVVSLPNCLYKSDEWFRDWKHRKPDEHISHFNEISLDSFMDAHGFDTIYMGNPEDTIRKNKDNTPNILTGAFKKRT